MNELRLNKIRNVMLIFQIRRAIEVFKTDAKLANFKNENPKSLYYIVYFISLLLTAILIPLPLIFISGILYLILYLMQIPVTFTQTIIFIFAADIIKDFIIAIFNVLRKA